MGKLMRLQILGLVLLCSCTDGEKDEATDDTQGVVDTEETDDSQADTQGEPVDADEVVSESVERSGDDGPLVINEDEVTRNLRTTPDKKVALTPDQLERMSEILKSIEEESEQAAERVNVSGNVNDYFE